MNIPGSDLLSVALSVIATQTVEYYKATGRTLNAVKQYVPSYAAPVMVRGSLQPVPRSRYEQFGLDFSKAYYTFYASVNIIDLQRDVSADQIVFNGQTLQCESNNDWFAMDGWKGVLCVLVNGAPDNVG